MAEQTRSTSKSAGESMQGDGAERTPDGVPGAVSCLLVCGAGAYGNEAFDELERLLRELGLSAVRRVPPSDLSISMAAIYESGGLPLVFIDRVAASDAALADLKRQHAVGVLVDSEENRDPPDALLDGRVQDLLVHPFRPADVVRVVLHARRHEAWNRLEEMNAATARTLSRIEKDLETAESIQQAFWPKRFPEVKGYRVEHRYLAGIRGGDWLDIAESSDGSAVSVVLSDGSSTGLSSLVSAAVGRMAARVSLEASRSPAETVPLLLKELQPVLQAKHKLSLFYGVITRADLKLRWVSLGAVRAWLGAGPGVPFVKLDVHGPAIEGGGLIPGSVLWGERDLKGEDRLVLASDGFIDALGGEESLKATIDRRAAAPSLDLLNDWVYAVKKDFEGEDDLPRQDCTGLVLEVPPRVLKLAPRG